MRGTTPCLRLPSLDHRHARGTPNLRAIKSAPSHNPSAGKAAETDFGDEFEDDDPDPDEQDAEDGRDIELAVTHAEMRKSMAAIGHYQKAIDRKIQKFTKWPRSQGIGPGIFWGQKQIGNRSPAISRSRKTGGGETS